MDGPDGYGTTRTSRRATSTPASRTSRGSAGASIRSTSSSTDAADGEAPNISSTDTIEILTLAREVRDQLAPDLDIEFDERHAADAEHTHAATSKAQELLDYEPTYTIREGVAAFIEWYRENCEWYEPPVPAS